MLMFFPTCEDEANTLLWIILTAFLTVFVGVVHIRRKFIIIENGHPDFWSRLLSNPIEFTC